MTGRLPGGAWLASVLSLLFPPQCPGCGVEVGSRSAWCSGCLQDAWQPRTLDTLAKDMPHVDVCQVLVGYDGAVRKLLHGLKFERRRGDAAPFYSNGTRLKMRAEILSVADEIKQSAGLLRRHL